MKGGGYIILILILAGVIVLSRAGIDKDQQKARRNFKDLDLVMTGVVESVDLPENFNGFGVLRVKILNSNKSYYDPRTDNKYYYCLIKNNTAELYQFSVDKVQIGDTIKVNTMSRRFGVYKNKSLSKQQIILYTNERFFRWVEKEHQKF